MTGPTPIGMPLVSLVGLRRSFASRDSQGIEKVALCGGMAVTSEAPTVIVGSYAAD